MSGEDWWRDERLRRLRWAFDRRAACRKAIEGWFAAQDFVAVETPALQVSPGLEPHLAAFETVLLGPGRYGLGEAGEKRYLHTSPEFAMKKLIAGGMERIWQLSTVFRNAEGSPTHQPEFRMLEWYRAEADYRALMTDCRDILRAVANGCGVDRFHHRGRDCDPYAQPDDWTCAAAFREFADIDLRACIADAPDAPPVEPIAEAARRIGVRVGEGDRFDDVFHRVFAERIEPHLGSPAPAFIRDYPVSMAALSRAKPEDPVWAERVELYVAGLELANGFSELTDAAEQRRRFEEDLALKEALYGVCYPIDEDFLAAVDAMPPTAGMAMGFDRLVMLACGLDDIADTLWAPVSTE